jgi:protein tyrosine/serine phosphatase
LPNLKSIRHAIGARLFPAREGFAALPADERARRDAWIDFLFVDFGILRLFWKNFARVGQNAVRMNQPYPGDIDKAAARGVKTIVTARHDPRHGGNALVMERAKALGLDYVTYPLFSREAPTREAMLDAPAFFQSIRYPALFHCKSGADRAGFLSALYLIVQENVPVRLAKDQLSWRFLHFSASKTGILDAVFAAYLKDQPSEAKPFLDWVRDDYDRDALMAQFRAGGVSDFVERVILRRE